MSLFDRIHFKDLKEEFNKVTKRILRKDISKNKDTLRAQESDVIAAYNSLVSYVDSIYGVITEQEKTFVFDEITRVRDKISRCFGVLRCKVRLPNDSYTVINIDDLTNASGLEEDDLEDEYESEHSGIFDQTIVNAKENSSKSKSTNISSSGTNQSTASHTMSDNENENTAGQTAGDKRMTEFEFMLTDYRQQLFRRSPCVKSIRKPSAVDKNSDEKCI